MFKKCLVALLVVFVLSVSPFIVGCEDMGKKMMMPIMTEPDDKKEDEKLFGDVPRINVSDAIMQEKIAGPWLWMIAPTEHRKGGAASIDVDSLAIMTDNVVTEMDIVANGVNIEDMIGDLTWKIGTISVTGGNNVNKLVNEIGLGQGNLDHHSSYALIVLVSDMDQSGLTMRVGSDDAVKVWLNNQVVHKNAVNRGSTGFQDEFEVSLKKGDNLVLVKVSEGTVSWTMFVGIEKDDTTDGEE